MKNGNPLKCEGIRSVLRRACKRAGISKRIYPHIFRHWNVSRSKAGAPGSIPKDQIDVVFGWEDPSMLKLYGPLNYKEFDKNYSEKRFGIKKEVEGDQKKICKREDGEGAERG
jgi:integrase